MTGLEQQVFGQLPDATWIFPGHGNDTTLGAERPHLEEWRARAGRRCVQRASGPNPPLWARRSRA